MRRFDPGHAADDAVATRNWTMLNSEKVTLYQQRSQKEGRPFLLAWQTDWMLGKLATLGHGSTVSMDATFGTNKYGFQLVTVVCFDAFQNGIPCLWAIMERHETVDLVAVLTEVKKKVNAYRIHTLRSPKSWRLSCFLVDDAKEENLALREVFPDVPVNLCLWHVSRAWLKKLHSLVKDPFGKAEMNRGLGRIMYSSVEEGGYSEVALLHRLGTQWGTIAGGVENMDPCNQGSQTEVAGLDLPVHTLSSDSEDDDCVILPIPESATAAPSKKRTLAQFQKEVGTMYAQVSHSTYLCESAFEFVLEAVGRALHLKAASEVQEMGTEVGSRPQPFLPVPGNDSTLKRRKDFMERFISRRKKQRVVQDRTEIDDDNRFQRVPSQNMTMQEALDRATHESLDLNVSLNMTTDQSNGVPVAPSKRRTNKRAVQRLFKEQVEVLTQRPDVILIE
ncbi:hypothetical protein R1sor_018014 [Riccia sorocarpa]|uniref:MULE transposase domain-containing protein n=1 Tax=Riccia sorocarpa TaxID=122646 RepID=A0ABD3I8M0_9MARC